MTGRAEIKEDEIQRIEKLTQEGDTRGEGNPKEADPLVRIANALEKLASDPEVEIEAGPPICPNCGAFDPVMALPEQAGGQGRMSQLIVSGQCLQCNGSVFIIIESYSVHKSNVTAANEIKERERVGFFNGPR